MSLIPFFPSLKPHTANHIWFDLDTPYNDEAEVQALEKESFAWLTSIATMGQDLNPLGKVFAGPETDDEDANDDTDDSDSHDEEDDEIDRLIVDSGSGNTANRTPMETSYSPTEQNNTNNDVETIAHVLEHGI